MTPELATDLTNVDYIALGVAIVGLLVAVRVALMLCGGHGFSDLWRGKDGRASTSQFQAVIWTVAVAWALLSLLIAELISSNADSALSVGWDAFRGENPVLKGKGDAFQADYLALLGIPIGTAVAAKAITSSKVSAGTVVKPPSDPSTTMRRQALDLIGDDHGRPAVLDFQLVIFNLLLLAYFAGTFLTEPTSGLPNLPETLLTLAGVSSGSYALNKALERTTGPPITSVRPSRIALGAQPTEIDIYGGPFGAGPHTDLAETATPPLTIASGVTLEGVPLDVTEWSADHIKAVVPAITSAPNLAIPEGLGNLVVHDAAGVPSEPQRVEVVAVPAAAAPVASDALLGAEVLDQLAAQEPALDALEAEEEALTAAAAPAGDEPGDSALGDEPVLPDTED